MDDLTQTPVPNAETRELRQELDALRNLVNSLLILVLLISGTMNVYLWYRYKHANKDLETARPRTAQIVAEYSRGAGPGIDRFIGQLAEYGKTHPDFAPILAKYGMKPAAAGAAPIVPAPQGTLPAAKK